MELRKTDDSPISSFFPQSINSELRIHFHFRKPLIHH